MFYAGSIARAGGNSELHVVDERIVGHMPKTLSFARRRRAAIDRYYRVGIALRTLANREGKMDEGQSLLIVGAAGGVGSILTQLARQLTGLKVIGTASRPQTEAWVRELGADQVIDHSQAIE